MATVLRIGRIRITIRTNDHGNPHVHVIGPGAEAKIFIETLHVERARGFSETELNKLGNLVDDHQDVLMEKWNEYHKK